MVEGVVWSGGVKGLVERASLVCLLMVLPSGSRSGTQNCNLHPGECELIMACTTLRRIDAFD